MLVFCLLVLWAASVQGGALCINPGQENRHTPDSRHQEKPLSYGVTGHCNTLGLWLMEYCGQCYTLGMWAPPCLRPLGHRVLWTLLHLGPVGHNPVGTTMWCGQGRENHQVLTFNGEKPQFAAPVAR